MGFSWQLDSSLYLTWENLYSYKIHRVEFIGLDIVTNRKAVSFIWVSNFFNFDSKVLLKFGLTEWGRLKLILTAGVGGSINLGYNSDGTSVNRNLVLESDQRSFFYDESGMLNGSGVMIETGAEIRSGNFSIYISLVMDLIQTHLVDVGDVYPFLTAINFLYYF